MFTMHEYYKALPAFKDLRLYLLNGFHVQTESGVIKGHYTLYMSTTLFQRFYMLYLPSKIVGSTCLMFLHTYYLPTSLMNSMFTMHEYYKALPAFKDLRLYLLNGFHVQTESGVIKGHYTLYMSTTLFQRLYMLYLPSKIVGSTCLMILHTYLLL